MITVSQPAKTSSPYMQKKKKKGGGGGERERIEKILNKR